VSGTLSIDFGVNVPGESGVNLTGTTLATAYLLHKKVTVIQNAVSGAIALLPSSYASGTALQIKNRSNQTVIISPGLTNQIENDGVGIPVEIDDGDDLEFVSFDPPASPSPRTWWLSTSSGGGSNQPDIGLQSGQGTWLWGNGVSIQWGGGGGETTLTLASLTALLLTAPTTLPTTPGVLWMNGGVPSIS
jgi:hypothetical protein